MAGQVIGRQVQAELGDRGRGQVTVSLRGLGKPLGFYSELQVALSHWLGGWYQSL